MSIYFFRYRTFKSQVESEVTFNDVLLMLRHYWMFLRSSYYSGSICNVYLWLYYYKIRYHIQRENPRKRRKKLRVFKIQSSGNPSTRSHPWSPSLTTVFAIKKAIACNHCDSFVPRIYSCAGYTSMRFRCNRGEDLSSTTASLQLYREIHGRSVYRFFFCRHVGKKERKTNVGKKHFYDPRYTLSLILDALLVLVKI